jgi:hypothetical protein
MKLKGFPFEPLDGDAEINGEGPGAGDGTPC